MSYTTPDTAAVQLGGVPPATSVAARPRVPLSARALGAVLWPDGVAVWAGRMAQVRVWVI